MQATKLLLWASICLFLVPQTLQAQRKKKSKDVPQVETLQYDKKLYEGLNFREVGPYRGGRSCAVTGVPGQPLLFYFGSTGGGVWRTKDGGQSWENISDGYFGGSIGAVAVSEYDPNVLYVGGGEKTVRGNVSYGYGVWKSVNAGKSWQQMGLENTRHISRIRIHPKNPDRVYAAVMGDLYKPSKERGVYRSDDGGENWERILFANKDAGAVDLTLDPSNPRILYASTWRIRRTPYSLSSGGEGSALWKSTDGGDTWEELSKKEGFPDGPLGIIGVTVSPQRSDRVWAIVEAEEGGVFRSDDGGETWRRFNSDRALRQRAWYYTRIYADTEDDEVVYVLNVRYHKSTDGGRTFKPYNAPHGDHHDLWIAPEDPQRMIIGDDGGAQVSYDGGENWSTYYNQPTSQFYRVTTDNHFPYRIYAAQQDNSTVRILHRTEGRSIDREHWESTAGGESAHIAVDPKDNDIVYGGSYGGYLTRINHRTGERRAINVWPDNPMGYGAEGMKYRFQWNFPIAFSPHDANKLYAGSNHLHMSKDGGQSWEIISPDLTRNDPEKLLSSGGPITQDNTGVEYYCTVFAMAESPQEEDLIWVGSDDGLLHITQNGGDDWANVTPPQMPEWTMINSIEVDPFIKGGVYVAGTRYKLGDYTPYLYHSKDYGKTWQTITAGIDEQHFTRVLRVDPERQGLLYAGTETGLYISFDDGASWKAFQQNLPIVPVTDITLKNNNLIIATQGRGLWMIDDLTPLHQLNAEMAAKPWHLYQPIASYRMGGGQARNPRGAGTNHPGGVMVNFVIDQLPEEEEIELSFYEAGGDLIRTFSTGDKENKLTVEQGYNRFVWNMRYEDAKDFKGMILWWGQMSGPKAVPGQYYAKLKIGEDYQKQDFEILIDPRIEASVADLQAQFDHLIAIRNKLTETHQAIIDIRAAREQFLGLKKRVKDKEGMEKIVGEISRIDSAMSVVEKALYQTKNRSGQDPLNFPIQLNNKLAHLASLSSIGDNPPTDQALAFFKEVSTAIDEQLNMWYEIRDTEVPAFNELVHEATIDAVILE
ncbi:MAG: WD40/YVTN/BNR-like repeat-containing protein [Bacteroidia bacterium]